MQGISQQHTDGTISPQSAGPVRVTADEFTAALKAIEARRAAAANEAAGTVEVESMLRELHIDATPEDVVWEVEAMRAAKAAKDKAAADAKERADQVVFAAKNGWSALKTAVQESTASTATQPVMVAPVYYQQRRQRVGLAGWLCFAAMLAIAPVMVVVTADAHNHHLTTTDTAKPVATHLSGITDGDDFYASAGSVKQIMESGGKITAADRDLPILTADVENVWELADHGGVIYLRGYTLPGSEQRFPIETVNVYNDDNSGELYRNHDESVTVSLAGAKLAAPPLMAGSDYSMLAMENVHPDGHFNED